MVKDEELRKVAEALFVSATENNNISLYQEQLKFFTWILSHNSEYFDFLTSSIVNFDDKVSTLGNVFKGAFDDNFIEFIKLLLNKKYISDIFTIRDIFLELVNARHNIVTGILYSPFELSREDTSRLEKAFSKRIGKTVMLKFSLDPSLIVGIKVVLEGSVYELTALSQLDVTKKNIVKSIEKTEEGE